MLHVLNTNTQNADKVNYFSQKKANVLKLAFRIIVVMQLMYFTLACKMFIIIVSDRNLMHIFSHLATWQMVNGVLLGLSSTLGVQPPANGSLDPYPSASETPVQKRMSSSSAIVDSPVGSPVTS